MVTGAGLSRRALLLAACAATGGALPAFAVGGPRLAAVDWAMAETAMALSHPPARWPS